MFDFIFDVSTVIRIFIILFVFPVFSWTRKENIPFALLFWLMCLPFSWSMAYLGGVELRFLIAVEITLVLLFIENFLLFSLVSDRKAFLSIYLCFGFIWATLPIFVYYLYLDVFEVSLSWLCAVSPFGILERAELHLYNFLFLLYAIPLYSISTFHNKK